MKVSGSYGFPLPAPRVWAALTDPTILAGCIPGCEALDPLGEGQYQAVVTLGLGPIQGQYRAKITMRDQDPPRSYRLVFEGTGSIGFASGEALITLVEQNGQTTVQVDGDAQVGGAVARVGQRMMGGAAKTLLDRFFGCLEQSAR